MKEAAPGPSRYRGIDMVAHPAGPGQEMLVSLLDDRTALVPARTSVFLARCSAFRSLDEHAEHICRSSRLRPERAATVRQRLESLADAGFLISHDELLRRCRSHTPDAAQAAPIEMIGVPSSDRPDALARALRSYTRNSRDYGRDVEFVVMDDSPGAASQVQNLVNLTVLRREFGTRVSYSSALDRETYARALAREADLSMDVVRFALLKSEPGMISTGACRNALLLHAAGERFIHVDDDTVCNVAPAPDAQPGFVLAAAPTGIEQAFFASGEQARAAVSFGREDYVGLHERLLGRTVADVLSEAAVDEPDEPIDLDLLPPQFARRLQDTPCRIAVASMGVVGDSGLGSTEMYLFTANAVSRARLLAFPGGYREAFRSLQVIRATPRTTIAEAGPCLGIGLSLDARGLLPPFMPVLRNSDGVFSQVRQTCLPATAMAFLPWVVQHSPPATRCDSFEAVLRHAGRIGFTTLLIGLIRTFVESSPASAPERALAALGRHLVDVGSLAPSDYVEQCREIVRKRADGMHQYVATLEARWPDAPSEWQRDVSAYLTAVREGVQSDAGVVPTDLERPGLSATETIAIGQRLVRRYGELLGAWPTMVDVARQLRRREQRPARVLS